LVRNPLRLLERLSEIYLLQAWKPAYLLPKTTTLRQAQGAGGGFDAASRLSPRVAFWRTPCAPYAATDAPLPEAFWLPSAWGFLRKTDKG